jgi:hypothetical protein
MKMKLKDWVDKLIWATILVTVVRYSAAFMASDLGEITGLSSNIVTFFLTLTGLGMGILDTLGGGLLFNGWSRVFPKAGIRWSMKFKILTFCVFALVISGMIILVPFTVSRLAHESVLDTLGGSGSFWTWLWSGMVNFIPYVLIIGVFAGNKMVTDLESLENGMESSKKVPENLESSMESSKKDSWRKIRPGLSKKDLEGLANLSPNNMRTYASQTGYTYKTISNWRMRARLELGLKENE